MPVLRNPPQRTISPPIGHLGKSSIPEGLRSRARGHGSDIDGWLLDGCMAHTELSASYGDVEEALPSGRLEPDSATFPTCQNWLGTIPYLTWPWETKEPSMQASSSASTGSA